MKTVTVFFLGMLLVLASGCGTMPSIKNRWGNNPYVQASDKNELSVIIECPESEQMQFLILAEKSKLFKEAKELPISIEQIRNTSMGVRLLVKLKGGRVFKRGEYVLQIRSEKNGVEQLHETSFTIKIRITSPLDYFQVY